MMSDQALPQTTKGPLIYRQPIWVRLTHWTWAIALFFLLLSGLQIFNAHPALYVGQQSGFEFDNAALKMYAEAVDGKARGITEVFGHKIDTTGVFGMSGPAEQPQFRGFPAALSISFSAGCSWRRSLRGSSSASFRGM
jgi:thiosulfate reductase cytochrome b subunit